MNTKNKVGVTLSANAGTKNDYTFEMMTDRKHTEKKVASKYEYSPRFYIRTPDSEIVEFTATGEYNEDKSFKVKAKLDKITKIPFDLSGKLYNSIHF